MGAVKKLFRRMREKQAASTRPGGMFGDSRDVTGIAPGDAGSNRGGGGVNNRRPGRRGADTPLGPGRNRM